MTLRALPYKRSRELDNGNVTASTVNMCLNYRVSVSC